MVKPKSVVSMNPKTVEVTVTCPRCGRESRVWVPLEGFNSYYGPEHVHVQDAFPELEPELRELLVSGLCITCQDEIF